MIKFTETHEWVRIENEIAVVGITEHAQHLLGDLVYVEFPTLGKVIKKGDTLGVVESVKAASDIYAPVSGEIQEINDNVSNNPALVNTDPLNAGWLVKISLTEAPELESLMDEGAYQKWLGED